MLPAEPTIAGIDEAGRGALAGPVVAGACVMTQELFEHRGKRKWWSPSKRGSDVIICDSKQMEPEEREAAFAWITEHLPFGVGIVSQDIIDRKGILAANQEAMRRALAQLRQKTSIESILFDGRDKFSFDLPHTSVIRGDSIYPCIAAASIVAKVTRDRLMMKMDRVFQNFAFAVHKGYGTALHHECLLKWGVSTVHRKTFVKTFLAEQTEMVF